VSKPVGRYRFGADCRSLRCMCGSSIVPRVASRQLNLKFHSVGLRWRIRRAVSDKIGRIGGSPPPEFPNEGRRGLSARMRTGPRNGTSLRQAASDSELWPSRSKGLGRRVSIPQHLPRRRPFRTGANRGARPVGCLAQSLGCGRGCRQGSAAGCRGAPGSAKRRDRQRSYRAR
jgi:hypothetical protein